MWRGFLRCWEGPQDQRHLCTSLSTLRPSRLKNQVSGCSWGKVRKLNSYWAEEVGLEAATAGERVVIGAVGVGTHHWPRPQGPGVLSPSLLPAALTLLPSLPC